MEFDRIGQECRDKNEKLYYENLRRELYYIMSQMGARNCEVLGSGNFIKININGKYEVLYGGRILEINKVTRFEDVVELNNGEIEVIYDGKFGVFNKKGVLINF